MLCPDLANGSLIPARHHNLPTYLESFHQLPYLLPRIRYRSGRCPAEADNPEELKELVFTAT